jgi:hypothetical protein
MFGASCCARRIDGIAACRRRGPLQWKARYVKARVRQNELTERDVADFHENIPVLMMNANVIRPERNCIRER